MESDKIEPSPSTISPEDFKKVEIRVGTVKEARKVEKKDRLLHLRVSFGGDDTRDVIAGIAQSFSPEVLIGQQFMFVTNLVPYEFAGIKSCAMILAAKDVAGSLSLTRPTSVLADGARFQ